MSRSEQSVVREMCRTFLHDSVPEYIRDAAYYISPGEVQKINIQEGETWDVQGVIQGGDLRVYTPSLSFTITDHGTRHQCNCSDAFTGICRHNGGLALRLVEELRKEQGDPEDTPPPSTDWKQSFRNFFHGHGAGTRPPLSHLPFRTRNRAAAGFPFPGRQNKNPACPACTTKSRWSRSSRTLNGANSLPSCRTWPGRSASTSTTTATGWKSPQGLTSWFFWSVRKEYYLLWKDTDMPCRIEARPFPQAQAHSGRLGLSL